MIGKRSMRIYRIKGMNRLYTMIFCVFSLRLILDNSDPGEHCHVEYTSCRKEETESQSIDAKVAGICHVDCQRMKHKKRGFRNCMGVILSLLLSVSLQSLCESRGAGVESLGRYKAKNKHSLPRPAEQASHRKHD